MFSKRLNRVRKTIGFRMVFWYSSIFILSSSLLFSLIYFLLSSSFSRNTREDLSLKVKEYAEQYETAGLDGLRKEVSLERQAGKAFFVRFAGPADDTVFVQDPFHWVEPDFELSNRMRRDPPEQWFHLEAPDGSDTVDIASTTLVNGYALQVGRSTHQESALLERFREMFAGIMVPVVLIGIVGGAIVAYRSLHPLRSLLQTIRSISTGRMDARVPSNQTGDELDELVVLFNSMLEKIETLIGAMRGSLDNVAHDLRTPLTRLRGTAEMALHSGSTKESCQEALADCVEESDKILTMLNTLMDISEAETGTMKLAIEPIDVRALIEDTVELYRYIAEEKEVTLSAQSVAGLFLSADRNRMRQVLANLVDNAVKYTPTGGRIELDAFQKDHRAAIVVRDSGAGIPGDEMPRIWDRLYRGDKSRSERGLGLGLSLVKAVVHAHNGSIEASSTPGKGSTFAIYLPVCETHADDRS